MPVAEIVKFTPTEEYIADGSLAAKSFEHVRKAKGALKAFRGFAVNDNKQAYFVLVWDEYSSFEAATKHEDFPAFVESLKFTMKERPPSIEHIAFDEDTTNAFSAPITEYSIVKPKEGTTQAEIIAIIEKLKGAAPNVPGTHPPIAWGPFRKSPEVYAMAAGWDSVQAHSNAITISPVDQLAAKLFEIADVTVVHLALTVEF